MMPLSIRMRLTLTYSLVLTLTLGLLGAGLFFVMRRSVYAAVDEDLRGRLEGVQRLMQREIPKMSGQELREEFREHSGLRPGGDMLEVWDQTGTVVFESSSIREYKIPAPKLQEAISFDNRTVSDRPIRVLTASLSIVGQDYTVLLATAVGQTQQAVTRFGWLLLASIPAVLGLAALGGYVTSGRALAPVDQITNTARSISTHNLSQRLATLKTGDELQRLSETLNDMMSRLQSSFQKVNQFTADASHELRTPIALIRTTAELSLRRRRDEAEYRKAMSEILQEAERTTSLIENLLVLARADSGSQPLEFCRSDLTSIVQDACQQGSRLAKERDVELCWDLPRFALTAAIDPQAMRRLLLSLIDNAVKYSSTGSRVTVHLDSDASTARIRVEDFGIGIAPEDLPNIFERFYRADKARSRDAGGAGLGLSIAQWIVRAHHGRITVESTPETGSIFSVTLPLTG